jgi:signal transduction histidine kinase
MFFGTPSVPELAPIDSIGRSSNDLPKALERFGQLDTDPNRRHQGAGLGLPLAQHLMEVFPRRRIVLERSPVRAVLPLQIIAAIQVRT